MSELSKLVDMEIDKVAGVDKPANQREFLVIKRADDEDEEMSVDQLKEAIEKAGRTLSKDNLEALIEAHDSIMDILTNAGVDPYSIMDMDYMEKEKEIQKEDDDNMEMMNKGDFMELKKENMYEKYKKMAEKMQEMEKSEDVEKSAEEDLDQLIKKEDLPEEVREQLKKQKEMEDKIEKMEQERIEKKYREEVKKFNNIGAEKDKLKEVLKFVGQQDEELYEDLEEVLKAADKAVEEGDLFKEKGKPGTETGSSAIAKMEGKAEEIAKEEGISKEKAIAKAMKQNPELYEAYEQELQ